MDIQISEMRVTTDEASLPLAIAAVLQSSNGSAVISFRPDGENINVDLVSPDFGIKETFTLEASVLSALVAGAFEFMEIAESAVAAFSPPEDMH